MQVSYIMGPTCVGKSTLINLIREHGGDAVRSIEVGKMLREKYPPEHFAGQNNPKHTASEAWGLFLQGLADARDDPQCKLVLVDGQPRDRPQARDILRLDLDTYGIEQQLFVVLDASVEVRENRARATRDPHEFETLTKPRLTNDMLAYYEVLMEMMRCEAFTYSAPFLYINTDNANGLSPEELFARHLRQISGGIIVG